MTTGEHHQGRSVCGPAISADMGGNYILVSFCEMRAVGVAKCDRRLWWETDGGEGLAGQAVILRIAGVVTMISGNYRRIRHCAQYG